MMQWVILCCFSAAILIFAINSQALSKISLDSKNQLIDEFSRVRMFHGLNNVEKSPPWFSHDLWVEALKPEGQSQLLKYYKDWGFNFVRLGTMWSGAFPQPHQLNSTYLRVLTDITDGLSKHGIYSLLDMHQDIISSKFDAYDGVPRWLIDSFPAVPDVFAYPWPLNSTPPKYPANELSYMTFEVGQAFQDLYTNKSRAWDHWIEFWINVSRQFVGKASIIGYELINEPWAGNFWTDWRRLLPGYANRENLLPVYDKLVQAIRLVDNDTLIFFEPVTWSYYVSSDDVRGIGLHRLPGNSHGLVMSFHYYCFVIQGIPGTQPFPWMDEIFCDDFLAKEMFSAVKFDQDCLNMGVFFTEFGNCFPDEKSNKSINNVECEFLLKQTENRLISWAYWDSVLFDANTGEPLWPAVRTFSRAYPSATAGQPLRIDWDGGQAHFIFEYLWEPRIQAPTEIFVPLAAHYGGTIDSVEVSLTCSPLTCDQSGLRYRWNTEDSMLYIESLSSSMTDYWMAEDSILVKVELKKN